MLKLPKYPCIFPEGNNYILHKDIAFYLYDDRFNIYKTPNSDNSFDYNWFINY